MVSKRIVIVAGEASGDQHAAHLVQQLRQLAPQLQFSGMGGTKMELAGVNLLSNLAQYGVVGFIEVISHFTIIRRAFKLLQQSLIACKPDLLILVDYPGFNLRLAKFAKALGIKILYYISPQIWAWKAQRIITIKNNVDMMAVILPFEKPLYQQAGVPVQFVGHPLTTTVEPCHNETVARMMFGLQSHSTVIGLLPGSRKMELRRMLPIMLAAATLLAQQHPELEFVLPLASSLTREDLTPYLHNTRIKIKIIKQHYYDLINCCHSLMIASGTATLEAALLQKPMIIVFKTSALSYTIATQVIQVKYIGLCNLLANHMLVPELIQQDLTAAHLSAAIQQYILQTQLYHETTIKLAEIKKILSKNYIDCSLPELVLKMLGT